jgi:hypothetical protein
VTLVGDPSERWEAAAALSASTSSGVRFPREPDYAGRIGQANTDSRQTRWQQWSKQAGRHDRTGSPGQANATPVVAGEQARSDRQSRLSLRTWP